MEYLANKLGMQCTDDEPHVTQAKRLPGTWSLGVWALRASHETLLKPCNFVTQPVHGVRSECLSTILGALACYQLLAPAVCQYLPVWSTWC